MPWGVGWAPVPTGGHGTKVVGLAGQENNNVAKFIDR